MRLNTALEQFTFTLKDRDEIFFELHKMGFEEFYKRQLAIQSVTDPLQRLTDHGLAYIQFAIDQPQYYDLMFISQDSRKDNKKSSMNGYRVTERMIC